MEFAVASQWLLRIGILILVVGVGFFLKYSIDRTAAGPRGRPCAAVDDRRARRCWSVGRSCSARRYHVFGQGLLGGGLATLYFCVFAAVNLLSPDPSATLAFGLMTLVTVLAGGIAVRFNSMLVAVLGILGGYGTPVMLSTGAGQLPRPVRLHAGAGRRRAGDVLLEGLAAGELSGFFCTYGLYFAGDAEAPEPTTSARCFRSWSAFFVLFSTMTFLYKIVNGTKSNLLDLFALIAQRRRLLCPVRPADLTNCIRPQVGRGGDAVAGGVLHGCTSSTSCGDG